MTEVLLFFWPLVFEYLEPEDLVNVSSVCLAWWRYVFQGRESTVQALQHCEQIHLADTGKLYQKVPLHFFSKLTWLNLIRTAISSKDFLKLLETLNIQSCMEISEQAIFKAKGSLLCLRNINISFNEQFSVLAVACLCSYYSLQDIRARGIKLDGKEALFLTKTFPRLRNGRITLDIGSMGGEYFFDAVNILSDQ